MWGKGPAAAIVVVVVGAVTASLAQARPATCETDQVLKLAQPSYRCAPGFPATLPTAAGTCCGDTVSGAGLGGDDKRRLERLLNPSKSDKASCRVVEYDAAYCPADQVGCATMEHDDVLEIALRFDSASDGETCANTCFCYGDPECMSFDGRRDEWVICDGRGKKNCEASRKPCKSQRDHTGRQCKFLQRKDGWVNQAQSGSQCQADWEESGRPTMTMYEVDGFKMDIVLSERGIIIEAIVTTPETGTLHLRAQDCLRTEQEISGESNVNVARIVDAWKIKDAESGEYSSASSAVPAFWAASFPNAVETKWHVGNEDAGVFVDVMCTRGYQAKFARLDIQRLVDLRGELRGANEGDGYCKTGVIDKGNATTREGVDGFSFHQVCLSKVMPDYLYTAKVVVDEQCSPYEINDCVDRFCEDNDISGTSFQGNVQACKDALRLPDRRSAKQRRKGMDPVYRVKTNSAPWVNVICEMNRAQDNVAHVGECIEKIGEFGLASFLRSNPLRAVSGTVDEYYKEPNPCKLGLSVEYKDGSGEWQQEFFVPKNKPPTGGLLRIRGDQHPNLFRYPIRLAQCSLSTECLAENVGKPTNGFEALVQFYSAEERPQVFCDTGTVPQSNRPDWPVPPLFDAAFSDDYVTVVLEDTSFVYLHSIKTGGVVVVLQGHAQPLTRIALNNEVAATASLDGTVGVWRVFQGSLINYFSHGTDDQDRPIPVRSVDVSTRGDSVWVVSGDEDGGIFVWKVNRDLVTFEEEALFVLAEPSATENKYGGVTTVAIKGNLIVAGTTGGFVLVWKIVNGSPVAQPQVLDSGLGSAALEIDILDDSIFVSGFFSGAVIAYAVNSQGDFRRDTSVSVPGHKGAITGIVIFSSTEFYTIDAESTFIATTLDVPIGDFADPGQNRRVLEQQQQTRRKLNSKSCGVSGATEIGRSGGSLNCASNTEVESGGEKVDFSKEFEQFSCGSTNDAMPITPLCTLLRDGISASGAVADTCSSGCLTSSNNAAVRTKNPFCLLGDAACSSLLTQTKASLTLKLALDDSGDRPDGVCCRSCSAVGDPIASSFNRELEEKFILCDARVQDTKTGKCFFDKDLCTRTLDHNGNNCVWNDAIAPIIAKKRAFVGAYGSPCQPAWETRAGVQPSDVPNYFVYPPLPLYQVDSTTANVKASVDVTLGERAVMEELIISIAIGRAVEFDIKLDANVCFQNTETAAEQGWFYRRGNGMWQTRAETSGLLAGLVDRYTEEPVLPAGTTVDDRIWFEKRVLSRDETEIVWVMSLTAGGAKEFTIQAVCIEEPAQGTDVIGYRLNVEYLSTGKVPQPLARSGTFCPGEKSMKEIFNKARDFVDQRTSEQCSESSNSVLELCQDLVGPKCSKHTKIVAQAKRWCKKAQGFTSSRECENHILDNKKKSVLFDKWVDAYCLSIKDCTVSEVVELKEELRNDPRAFRRSCQSRLQLRDGLDIFAKCGRGDRKFSSQISCSRTSKDYLLNDVTNDGCTSGLAVEYLSSSGTYVPVLFVPERELPCDNTLLINYGDSPLTDMLFTHNVRINPGPVEHENCRDESNCEHFPGLSASFNFKVGRSVGGGGGGGTKASSVGTVSSCG